MKIEFDLTEDVVRRLLWMQNSIDLNISKQREKTLEEFIRDFVAQEAYSRYLIRK